MEMTINLDTYIKHIHQILYQSTNTLEYYFATETVAD
jgi:hypothetical protein